jgi:TatD DNase family protein
VTWFDSHCHLQLADARDGDERQSADEQLSAARAAGVTRFVCVGTDLATSREAVAIAARHDDVWATVGLHPHDASRFDDEWTALVALARDAPRVVAVGECGFDLHFRHSEPDAQEHAFRAQIQLAHELDRTLVIHSREAWPETFAVLDDERVPPRTVFHCFTGGPREATAAIERGCHLSFSGIVSFKTADDLRAAAAMAPADRLLVETDAPYLAPVPHRGRVNVPAYVVDVGRALAAARSETVEAIAALTAANAARLFAVP